MDLRDALMLVLDLARQNVIEDRECLGNPRLAAERDRQNKAIEDVEGFILPTL